MNKPTGKEVRVNAGSVLRAASNFSISGIAAAYGVTSRNLGGFVEQIAPGAFANSLREGGDVKALFNHDPSLILGRTKSSTLTLSDSPEGLRFVCRLDRNNTSHQNVYASVQRGDIDECSFAFIVPADGDDWKPAAALDEDGHSCALRTLRNVQLLDVSAVTYPAYGSGTSVAARSAAGVARIGVPDYHIRCSDDEFRRRLEAVGSLVEKDLRAIEAGNAIALAEQIEQRRKDEELAARMRAAAGICFGRT